MVRPAPIPSDPVRSCSAPCRLPSPPRQCRHNLPQTPPPPRPDDGRVRRETVLLWKTALEWVQHRSPPQHMVWYLGCKPIFYSLKSRFDNFRTGPKNVASYKVSKDRNLCMGRAACDGQSRVRGNFFQIPTDRPTMPPLRLPRPTPAALSSPTAPAGCAIPCALGIDIAAARQAVEGDLLYKLR